MKCPKCESNWNVKNTADSSQTERQALISIVEPLLAWYGGDFRVRARECRECRERGHTVEVSIEDLLGMLQHARTDPKLQAGAVEVWCDLQAIAHCQKKHPSKT